MQGINTTAGSFTVFHSGTTRDRLISFSLLDSNLNLTRESLGRFSTFINQTNEKTHFFSIHNYSAAKH